MDYRHRKYYLIKTAYFAYEMRHGYYRIAAPSIKYHCADQFDKYRHPQLMKDYPWLKFSPQEMVSCSIKDASSLEYELAKARRCDFGYSKWIEITKDMIGQ